MGPERLPGDLTQTYTGKNDRRMIPWDRDGDDGPERHSRGVGAPREGWTPVVSRTPQSNTTPDVVSPVLRPRSKESTEWCSTSEGLLGRTRVSESKRFTVGN